jgi:hypothetical protein
MSSISTINPNAERTRQAQALAINVSAARGQMLSLRLGRMSEGVGGKAEVDAGGYLTALQTSSAALTTASDIADIKKARALLRSITAANEWRLAAGDIIHLSADH